MVNAKKTSVAGVKIFAGMVVKPAFAAHLRGTAHAFSTSGRPSY